MPTEANLLQEYTSFAELVAACERWCEKVNARRIAQSGWVLPSGWLPKSVACTCCRTIRISLLSVVARKSSNVCRPAASRPLARTAGGWPRAATEGKDAEHAHGVGRHVHLGCAAEDGRADDCPVATTFVMKFARRHV